MATLLNIARHSVHTHGDATVFQTLQIIFYLIYDRRSPNRRILYYNNICIIHIREGTHFANTYTPQQWIECNLLRFIYCYLAYPAAAILFGIIYRLKRTTYLGIYLGRTIKSWGIFITKLFFRCSNAVCR